MKSKPHIIGIGLLLVVVAIFIGFEVKALLVGQGVEPAIKEKMIAFLQQRDEIDRVYNLLTLQLGSDVMVAVKAKMAALDSETTQILGLGRRQCPLSTAGGCSALLDHGHQQPGGHDDGG